MLVKQVPELIGFVAPGEEDANPEEHPKGEATSICSHEQGCMSPAAHDEDRRQ